MRLSRSGADLVVQAPAKLNLFFEVLGKRDDGYHEIESLVSPIDLYDTLYFREDRSGHVTFACERISGSGQFGDAVLGEIPGGRENLVVRAVELLRERASVDFGAQLRLVKRIPAAAGLGGGSSDAAAALMAANVGWSLGWSQAQLAEVASELGSDVPLFLVGGAVVCRGRGERVEPVAELGSLHFVVVRPPAGLSTAQVYKVCRPAKQARRLEPLVESLVRGNVAAAGRLLFNRLEPAAESLSPWIARLRREFAATDCLGHQMSGSGTCYFGLYRHARHARRVARRLQASGVGTAFTVRGSR